MPTALTVTLSAGSSGGTNTGASILFTTDGGSLSTGTTSGAKVIAVTNGSGVASVTLTLPNSAANSPGENATRLDSTFFMVKRQFLFRFPPLGKHALTVHPNHRNHLLRRGRLFSCHFLCFREHSCRQRHEALLGQAVPNPYLFEKFPPVGQ